MHRTTIQLEAALERELRQLAHEQRRSLKEVMNDLLRRGLAALKTRTAKRTLEWHTASGKPVAGFDPADRETYLHHLDEGF